eukprot:g12252.t1
MCKCPTDCPCQFACHACQCIRPSVVLVDPYSTGLMLAPVIHQRGYEVIALWTSQVGENREHLPEAAEGFPENFLAEIDEEATLTLTAAALRAVAAPAPVAAVICGGETGVQVADALAEQMGLRGNSIKGGLENRRDKQEPFPIIVKPVESAGSDGVKLCQTPMEAEAHFHLYIVDHVSRNGVHKTAMVYVYDRRAANGAGFVCFGFRCVAAESPVAQELIRYTRGCLDALRITDGATHTEVMMTATGPCLVELNSRVNGAAGAWIPLARALTGYTQVDATVDAFLNGEAFDRLPDEMELQGALFQLAVP